MRELFNKVHGFVTSDGFKEGVAVFSRGVMANSLVNLPFEKGLQRMQLETARFDEEEFSQYEEQLIDGFAMVMDPDKKKTTYELFAALRTFKAQRFGYSTTRYITEG